MIHRSGPGRGSGEYPETLFAARVNSSRRLSANEVNVSRAIENKYDRAAPASHDVISARSDEPRGRLNWDVIEIRNCKS